MSSKSTSVSIRAMPTPVLTFLTWLEATQGRDKLYRFIQYFSKYVIHIMKQHHVSADIITRVSKGASAVGLTRKLMRVFRSLEYFNDALGATAISDDLERFLQVMKSISLGIWLVMDHVQWMHKAGYITVQTIKTIDNIHSQAWFIGLLCGAIVSTYKLKKLNDERNALTNTSKAESIDQARQKQMMGVVKNGLDMIIPAQRLGWVPVSDGTVGLCGTITSVIGIIDTWPKSK